MTTDRAVISRWISASVIFAGTSFIVARAIQLSFGAPLPGALVGCLLVSAAVLAGIWLLIAVIGRFDRCLGAWLDEGVMCLLGWAVSLVLVLGLVILVVRIALAICRMGGTWLTG